MPLRACLNAIEARWGGGRGSQGEAGGQGTHSPASSNTQRGGALRLFDAARQAFALPLAAQEPFLFFHTPPHAGGALEEAPPEVYKNRNPTK